MATPTTPVTVEVLQRFADGVWILDGSLTMGGGSMLTIPLRMTVLKAAEGELLVVSPLPPSQDVLSQLRQLETQEGCTVTKVLAPNAMHHTWARAFVAAHPGAVLFSTAGLKRRFPKEDWGILLGEGHDCNIMLDGEDEKPDLSSSESNTTNSSSSSNKNDSTQSNGLEDKGTAVNGQQQQCSVAVKEDVFGSDIAWRHIAGCSSLSEVVLLHKPSKTLVLSDLAFGLSDRGLKRFGWVFRLLYFPFMGMRQGMRGRRGRGTSSGDSVISYRRCCVTRIFAFMTDDADGETLGNESSSGSGDVGSGGGGGGGGGGASSSSSGGGGGGAGQSIQQSIDRKVDSGKGKDGKDGKKSLLLLKELEKMVEEWDFERVIMAHGECVREGGKEQFELGTLRFFRELPSVKMSLYLGALVVIGGLTACLGAGVLELWGRRRR